MTHYSMFHHYTEEEIKRLATPMTPKLFNSPKLVYYCKNCNRKLPWHMCHYFDDGIYIAMPCPLCGKHTVTSNAREKIRHI